MTTTIEKLDGITNITINGRLDSVTAPQFDREVSEAYSAEADGKLSIDCAGMEYISSAGLRSLITLLKKAKAAGRTLELHNLPASIRTIFDMTGFTSIFTII